MPDKNKVRIILEVDDRGSSKIKGAEKNLNDSFDKIKRGAKASAGRMARVWKSAGKGVISTFNRLKKAVFSLKTAFLAMAGGAVLFGIKRFTEAWENLAGIQEKAEAGMVQALKSMNRYTPELHENLLDVASGLQKVTTFGDEATIEGMKFLLTYRDITDDLLPRTSAAMLDLAQLMGGDTRQAANMLGKASMGMTGELRRVGITVDSNTYKSGGYLGVLKEIEKQVKGQARAIRETDAGGLIAFGNATGDIKEKLGSFTLKIKALVARTLLPLVEKVNEKLREMMSSTAFFDWAKKGAMAVLKAFRSMIKGVDLGIKIARTAAIAFTFAWENIKQTFKAEWIQEHIIGPLKQSYGWMKKTLVTAKEFYFGGEGKEGLLGVTTPEDTKKAIAEVEAGFDRLTKGTEFFKTGIDNAIESLENMKAPSSTVLSLPDKKKAGGGNGKKKQEISYNYSPLMEGIEAQLEARKRLQAEFNEMYKAMGKSRFEIERENLNRHAQIWEAAGVEKIRIAQWTEQEITRINREENEARLQFAQGVAGGIAETFKAVAEAGGRQSKEAFYIYQAAAMAEATIASALAISKTLAQYPGPAGWIMAGIIGAKMGIQLATIASASPPSYDQGGVSTKPGVYYAGVPEAHIPLQGGKVPVEMKGKDEPREIVIMNAVSPALFDSYLASPRGKRAIINIVSANAGIMKKKLR